MARKKPKGSRTIKVKRISTTRNIKSKPVKVLSGKYKGKRVYRKGGKLHVVDYKRDSSRKAKNTRKRTDPSYTGDVKGSRI